MRSTLAPPVRSSRSATFVSGPVGMSVTGVEEARDRPLHEVDGVLAERASAGGRQRRAVEAAVAVHVRRNGELTVERPVGAGGHGNVGAPGEIEHAKSICRRLLERLVPVDGRHTEHVELRARERQQQRDRVVVAGIAVEDDGDAHARQYCVDLGRGRQRRLGSRPRRRERPGRARAPERLLALASFEQ